MSHDGQLLESWLNDPEGQSLVLAILERKEKD